MRYIILLGILLSCSRSLNFSNESNLLKIDNEEEYCIECGKRLFFCNKKMEDGYNLVGFYKIKDSLIYETIIDKIDTNGIIGYISEIDYKILEVLTPVGNIYKLDSNGIIISFSYYEDTLP